MKKLILGGILAVSLAPSLIFAQVACTSNWIGICTNSGAVCDFDGVTIYTCEQHFFSAGEMSTPYCDCTGEN
jgi:hypothetical protein